MRDIDVCRALLRDLRIQHPEGSETRFVEELGICRGAARVDVAVVNGSLHGYEIKNEETLWSGYRLSFRRITRHSTA